jgi:DNA-binding GntR family transcriptional regulator
MAGPSQTSSSRVRDELQKQILAGAIKPGERQREEAVAQRLGTSRTPVREALLALAAGGLVELEPHRGAVVREFDPTDLIKLYELRVIIEPYAAALAAKRIDEESIRRLETLCAMQIGLVGSEPSVIDEHIRLNEEFHRIILDAADSPRLTEAMRGVGGIPTAFRSVFWQTDAQRELSLFCHRQLVPALAAGQAELAEAVMRMHVVAAKEYLLEVVRRDMAE